MFNDQWRGLVLGCAIAGAALAVPAHVAGAQQTAPDNTKVNQRDRQSSQKTADQQKNNRSDLETSRQIRKAIIADKSLSTYAHNIKIITTDGQVTLKGPVRTAAEKSAVEAKAGVVAGADRVQSQISVAEKGAATTKPKHVTRKVGL